MVDIQHVYLTGCNQSPCTIERETRHEISFEAIASEFMKANDEMIFNLNSCSPWQFETPV